MATTTVRKSTVTVEKNDITATAVMNGWNVNFNYKSQGSEKPTEFLVTGTKVDPKELGSFNYTRNTQINSFQFMSGAAFDSDLVKSVTDEIAAIIG